MIKIAKDMGNTYIEMADICGVSKTMISHWRNTNESEKPTYKQLEPIFKKYVRGRGRFKYKLEELPTSAIEYKPIYKYLLTSSLTVVLTYSIWFSLWKPCADNWKECNNLLPYQMVFYQMIKNNESFQGYKK